MAKDCQCHRLFYPTLIRSRSSNYVINSLKTKTTISPVITTLRTIGVMQRKKRKNEDDLLLKSKLSKPSYNNNTSSIHQLDSPIGKRTFPQERFESDYHQFKQAILISPQPQAFRLVSNGLFVGLNYDALIRPKLQAKLAKRITNPPELSQLSSNSTTCTTDNPAHEYGRRMNNRHITTTTRNSDHQSSSYQVARENCGRSRKASFRVNNPWRLRPIMSTPEQQQGPLPSISNPSPKIAVSEEPGDREQLIFTMSPFSSTQTLSTFLRSSATLPESHRSLKAFGRRKSARPADDLADESEDDEDERSISITSVLPIDIPQSHYKSN